MKEQTLDKFAQFFEVTECFYVHYLFYLSEEDSYIQLVPISADRSGCRREEKALLTHSGWWKVGHQLIQITSILISSFS